MGRFLAVLLLCAAVLAGTMLAKEKTQTVFFSLLFEQLLPDWMVRSATPDEAEGACAWL